MRIDVDRRGRMSLHITNTVLQERGVNSIERALHRLDEGTYGRSVRSGEPIPDERLEADPAAELTIEEARAAERR